MNQSTAVFVYNKASLFYTKNATHLKCQNLDIQAYANFFFVLHYSMYAYNIGKL